MHPQVLMVFSCSIFSQRKSIIKHKLSYTISGKWCILGDVVSVVLHPGGPDRIYDITLYPRPEIKAPLAGCGHGSDLAAGSRLFYTSKTITNLSETGSGAGQFRCLLPSVCVGMDGNSSCYSKKEEKRKGNW